MPFWKLKYFWWHHGDRITTFLSYAVIISFISFICYKGCGHSFSHATNETWCSQFIYFNPKTNHIDTSYSTAILYKDSLVSFISPLGKYWKPKDIISREEIKVDDESMDLITVRDGSTYKIMYIDSGACQSKSIMDSIKLNRNDSNDN